MASIARESRRVAASMPLASFINQDLRRRDPRS
jgi:hypothetical protein